MEFLQAFLPIMVNILLIALLIILIIIGIKAIVLMNRVNTVVDDVEKKVQSLNGLFEVLSNVSGKISFAYDKITGLFLGAAEKIFAKKKRRKKDEEDIDE
jgi:hypothetical protein